jgi:Calx-beta domain
VKVWSLILSASFLAFALSPAGAQVSVLTYHNNNQRTGLNPSETILNLTNVTPSRFGKLFSYAVDGCIYAQPLYVPDLNIPGQGTHNVLFIATENGTVYAFDADSAGASGGLLWETNLGAAVLTTTGTFTNKNFGTRYNGGAYTDIIPKVSITGTPVIDLNSGTLYVDEFTGIVGGGVTNYFHFMHALNITNGAERSFSPVVVAASVAGTGVDSVGGKVTFNAKQENQRTALTLSGGIIYVSYAGYADTDPYHGWIIGFSATNLAQLTNYVFNTTPNATTATFGANAAEGGIWMGGGGLCVDNNSNIFFMVGNGSFSATNNSGGTDFGDSFIKLTTTNGLAVADYFTPYNQATLQAQDSDLGSGGLILLPNQTGTFTNEMLGAGKQGQIYVINRDQFTTANKHFDSTNGIDFIVQTNLGRIGAAFDTPAYFNERIYYAAQGDNLKAIAVTNGALAVNTILTDTARTYSNKGATPSISANGTNNGIVWAIQMPATLGNPGTLVACNATNIATELYTSTNNSSRDQLGAGVKFNVPTVADGKVFVGSSNSVSIFGLLAGTFSFSLADYNVREANTNAVITVNRIGGTNGAVQVSYATVAGGTATNGVDYTDVSGALNWTNGESGSKSFSVPVLGNNRVQSNVTVNLALSNPTNVASALGTQSAVTLTIIEPPNNVWKLAYFGTDANNAAIAGDSADPNHDGIVNLLAYAYAFNPSLANTNPFTGNLVGNQFQLYFPRNTSADDITYILQTSSTLLIWSNLMTFTAASGWVTNMPGADVSESSSNGVPPGQYVNVTIMSSTNIMAGATNQFLRLQIHR